MISTSGHLKQVTISTAIELQAKTANRSMRDVKEQRRFSGKEA